MSTSGIYQITNIITGDFYIGSSANIEQRWKEHRKRLTRGNNGCVILQRAWSKYGEDAFSFSIIEVVEKEKTALLAREDYYIQTLKPAYNSTFIANSHLGMKRSDETKAKLRQRVWSEEARAKMSAARKGRTLSEEHKAKIRATTSTPEHRAHLSKKRNARPLASEESRAKMSAAQKINNNKPGARERQRQAKLGVPKSPEHLANWSKAREGHPVSEETREKLRQANLGKKYPPEVALKRKETRERNKRIKEV